MTKSQIAIGGLVMMFVTSIGFGAVRAEDVNSGPAQGRGSKETAPAVATDTADPRNAQGSKDGNPADRKAESAPSVSKQSGVRICPITGKVLRR